MMKIERYWNTIRYLRPIQIFSRLKNYLRIISIDQSSLTSLSCCVHDWKKPAKKNQSMLNESTFSFLNKTICINLPSNWNEKSYSKLWLYNLHYFDDLNAKNAEKRKDWHEKIIERWIIENKIGEGSGWEPYPLSLRIVNWIKWSLSGNALKDHWLESLAHQTRYLEKSLETHLMGNHLFSNAKALYFAGLFFSGTEADKWRLLGKKIIENELQEQLLNDGGNFELSTMYHLIFLEDLLDICNISVVYDQESPIKLDQHVIPMYKWLKVMCHPDEEISFFNDAALNIAPSQKEISMYGARLFGLKSFDMIDSEIQSESLIELSDSGYSRICSGPISIIIDRAAIGPDYIPGHAHADTLSFELSYYSKRVIVNSGTSVYQDIKKRHKQRSTSSHSTIEIDGENSSEVWSSFRVARRARVNNLHSNNSNNIIKISGCHDGYSRLKGSPIHCREWLLDGTCLTISDTISGKGKHEIKSVLPIHPEIKINQQNQNKVTLDSSGKTLSIVFEGNGKLKLMDSEYHPEFGLSIGNKHLVYSCTQDLPIIIITRIYW